MKFLITKQVLNALVLAAVLAIIVGTQAYGQTPGDATPPALEQGNTGRT